ncbi:hypothetical protein KM043_015759 [Ampulex compressa]|nr:hypothetical protein KM043_015759 [Ampulex compressa]
MNKRKHTITLKKPITKAGKVNATEKPTTKIENHREGLQIPRKTYNIPNDVKSTTNETQNETTTDSADEVQVTAEQKTSADELGRETRSSRRDHRDREDVVNHPKKKKIDRNPWGRMAKMIQHGVFKKYDVYYNKSTIAL